MAAVTRILGALVGAASLLVVLPAAVEAASAAPASVNFGSVALNTTVSQPIAVTIDAGYQVGGATGGLNPPFHFDFGTCASGGAAFIGPGTCVVNESFTPTALRPASDTLNVEECPTAGGLCIPIPVALSGNGVSAAAAAPPSVNFGSVALHTTVSQPIAVTIDAGYQVGGATGGLNPPFHFDFGTCASGGAAFIGPGTCVVNESFTPTALGPASDTLNVEECPTAGGLCIPIPVALSGNGVSAAAAAPPSVNFGSVALNTTVSQPIAVTIDAGYQVGGATGGLNPPFHFDFGTCASGGAAFIGPGTCVVNESFTPTALGPASDTLNVEECPTAGGLCIPIPVALSGNGVSAAAAAPPSVNFGSVALHTTVSQPIAVTIDAGYQVGGATGGLNPPFHFDFGTCASGGAAFIGPGTCVVNESFTPTALGPASDTLNVEECPTAGGLCIPISIPLTGTGVSVLMITTATLPSDTIGTPYPSASLQSTGGTPPVTWSVSSGSLPPGLTLDPATGKISGTPTAAGVFTFTVTATDSGTPTPQTASKSLSITVSGVADLAVSISGAAKPVSFPKPVTFTITVQNLGPNAAGAVVTDVLPSGSQFVTATTTSGSCVTPPVGSTGTITCTLGSLASGGSATITVVVQATVKKATISDTATVASDSSTIDPNPANNSATAIVQIK